MTSAHKTDETDKTDVDEIYEPEGDQASPFAETATAVRLMYKKYVAFHSGHTLAQVGAMTLFTLYTHVYDDFSFAPIVLVTAPTSEAGKSRLFDVAELLVREPFIVVDPSGPSIRNIMELTHPTLMIDEADLLKTSKDLRVVLNSGVEKGRYITRANARQGIIMRVIQAVR